MLLVREAALDMASASWDPPPDSAFPGSDDFAHSHPKVKTTKIVIKKGAGHFVYEEKPAWKYYYGVDKGPGRCSLACSVRIYAGEEGPHQTSCASIDDPQDQDSCYSCCGNSRCRQGKERWTSFFGAWATEGGQEQRGCVCCFHGPGRGHHGHYDPHSAYGPSGGYGGEDGRLQKEPVEAFSAPFRPPAGYPTHQHAQPVHPAQPGYNRHGANFPQSKPTNQYAPPLFGQSAAPQSPAPGYRKREPSRGDYGSDRSMLGTPLGFYFDETPQGGPIRDDDAREAVLVRAQRTAEEGSQRPQPSPAAHPHAAKSKIYHGNK